ncbi:MAG: hypothetical protein KAT28_05175 [Candidatus Aenigmarchaeota archaeon]|nr:hypothetical protein [Candidatus Aenigmarchaeota archaeon]
MGEIKEDSEELYRRLVEAGVYDNKDEARKGFEAIIESGIYSSPEEAVKESKAIIELAEGFKRAEKYLLEERREYDALKSLVDSGVYGSMREAEKADKWFGAVKHSGLDLC